MRRRLARISRRDVARRTVPLPLAAIVAGGLLACGLLACGADSANGPAVAAGTTLVLSTTGLTQLDAVRDGSYEAWVTDRAGTRHSAGRFTAGGTVSMASPVGAPVGFEVTLEPPGADDGRPSEQLVLHGTFGGSRLSLSIVGAVTQGSLELRERPGTFTMFTPSDNGVAGYPSQEQSGVWLFNMRPRETPQNDMWVRMSQLQRGWTYEGWMVRDYGAPGAVWLSYGKFVPDRTGTINQRDDTGWGPFSGVHDFRTDGVDEFPGDDWISNPLGYPFPAQLTLPLDLRERTPDGALRWTHVVTIEPASDRGEPIGSERPSVIRPYRDSFGDGKPGDARQITYRPEAVPAGSVEIR